jgi:hypothetical protein
MSEEGFQHYNRTELERQAKAGCILCTLIIAEFCHRRMGKGSLRLYALSPNQSLIRSGANDSEYPAKILGMGGILALWEDLPSMD